MNFRTMLLASFAVLCAVYATEAFSERVATQYLGQDESGFKLLKASQQISYHFYFDILGAYVNDHHQEGPDGSTYVPFKISAEPAVLSARTVQRKNAFNEVSDYPIPQGKPLTMKLTSPTWNPRVLLRLWQVTVVGQSKQATSAHVEFPDLYVDIRERMTRDIKHNRLLCIKVKDRSFGIPQNYVVWGDPSACL